MLILVYLKSFFEKNAAALLDEAQPPTFGPSYPQITQITQIRKMKLRSGPFNQESPASRVGKQGQDLQD